MTFTQFLHPQTRKGWTCRLCLYVAAVIAVAIILQLLLLVTA